MLQGLAGVDLVFLVNFFLQQVILPQFNQVLVGINEPEIKFQVIVNDLPVDISAFWL